MRIKVSLTVEPDAERVKALVKIAKMSGHGFDGCKAPGKLIRRLLESKVNDEVTYCLERVARDYED